MSEELKDKKDGSNSEGSPNEFVELLKKNKKSLAVIVVIAVVLLGIGILLGSLIGSRSGKNNNLQAGAQSSELRKHRQRPRCPMCRWKKMQIRK